MNKHKLLSFLLVLALTLTSFAVPTSSDAAKKPKLSKKKVTVYVGKTKKIKIKNASKKGKVTWKLTKKSKKKVKIVKKKKKGKKAYVKIKGKKKGKATLKAIYRVPGKKKKVLKCKITVKKKATPAATQQPAGTVTGTPVVTAGAGTAAPTGGQTAAPTGGQATTKPTATPRVTRVPTTATPEPTPKYPKTSYPPVVSFDLSDDDNILNEPNGGTGATITRNPDGTLTIRFEKQWDAVNFYLPDNAPNYWSEYKYVTLDYESEGYNLGDALYDADCSWGTGDTPAGDGETGKHPDWGQKIVVAPEGNRLTFEVGDGFAGDCLRGLQIFNPQETGNVSTITVKDIIFTTTREAIPTQKPSATPTSGPTNTPTSAPTNTPTSAPTNTPTAGPTDEPTAAPLPDVSGRLDNSKIIDDEGGTEATYDPETGKITINDTQSNDDDNGTVIMIPLPDNGQVAYGETVTIVLKGSSDGTADAFRTWIGDGPNAGSNIYRVEGLGTAGAFEHTFTLTAYTEEHAAGQNIGSNPINMLTIKSPNWNGPRLTGITIDSIDVYYTDRGAVIPTATPEPTEAPAHDFALTSTIEDGGRYLLLYNNAPVNLAEENYYTNMGDLYALTPNTGAASTRIFSNEISEDRAGVDVDPSTVENCIWIVEAGSTAGQYAFKNVSTGQYLDYGTGGRPVNLSDTKTDTCLWTIASRTGEGFDYNPLMPVANDAQFIRISNGSGRFQYGSTTSSTDGRNANVYFYKMTAAVAPTATPTAEPTKTPKPTAAPNTYMFDLENGTNITGNANTSVDEDGNIVITSTGGGNDLFFTLPEEEALKRYQKVTIEYEVVSGDFASKYHTLGNPTASAQGDFIWGDTSEFRFDAAQNTKVLNFIEDAQPVDMLVIFDWFSSGSIKIKSVVFSDPLGEATPTPAPQDDFMAYFSFDNLNEGKYVADKGDAVATVVGENLTANDDSIIGQSIFMPKGNDSYLDIKKSDGSSLLEGHDELTIAYWSKVPSAGSDTGWVYFAIKPDDDPNNRNYIAMREQYSNIRPATANGENTSASTNLLWNSTDDVIGKWKQVTVVMSATELSLYVNGELKATRANDKALSSYLDATDFYIGYSTWHGNGDYEYYQGFVDEFGIMDKALTADEVLDLYNSYGYVPPTPTPVPTPGPGEKLYNRVASTDDIKDGDQVLMIYNGAEFMLPEVVAINNRTGFNIEAIGDMTLDPIIIGDYDEKEWTFTKSGDDWLVGAGGKNIKFTTVSGQGIHATLEDEGSVLNIRGSENAFQFYSGSTCLNRNTTRPLINGYNGNPASFYLYVAAPVEVGPTPTAEPTPTPTAQPVVDTELDPANLVANGNFADGNTGWSSNFNATINAVEVAGTHAGLVQGRWNSYSGPRTTITGSFAPGDTLTYQFSILRSNTLDASYNNRFVIKFTESDTEHQSNPTSSSDGPANAVGDADHWLTYYGTYTVQEATDSINVIIMENGYVAYSDDNPSANYNFYIDDLQILHTVAPTAEPTATPVPTEVPDFAATTTLEDGGRYLILYNNVANGQPGAAYYTNEGTLFALTSTTGTANTKTFSSEITEDRQGVNVDPSTVENCIWIVEMGDNDQFALKNVSTGQYLDYGTGGRPVNLSSTKTDTCYWTLATYTPNDNGYTGPFTVINSVTDTTRYIRISNGSNRFQYGSSTSATDGRNASAYFYKMTAEVAPTPTPTAEPTPTPTAEPTATPLPDVSGRLDLSKLVDDEGGAEASYDPETGKITINDTQSNDNDNGTVIMIPLPDNGQVAYGETVTIVLKGSSDGTADAFRTWIGDGPNSGSAIYRVEGLGTEGAFARTFTLTAYTEEHAAGQNIGSNPINMLTIKSPNWNGPRLTGITIDSIDIYYTERGAVVPTDAPTPTPRPDLSGPIDLSTVASENNAYYDELFNQLVIDDPVGNTTTTLTFPLPGEVDPGEKVVVVIKGSSEGTCSGFRAWIGDGPNSHSSIARVEGLATPAPFKQNLEITVNANTSNNTMLTLKSLNWDGPALSGLYIDSIDFYYVDRGAVVPDYVKVDPTVGTGDNPVYTYEINAAGDEGLSFLMKNTSEYGNLEIDAPTLATYVAEYSDLWALAKEVAGMTSGSLTKSFSSGAISYTALGGANGKLQYRSETTVKEYNTVVVQNDDAAVKATLIDVNDPNRTAEIYVESSDKNTLKLVKDSGTYSITVDNSSELYKLTYVTASGNVITLERVGDGKYVVTATEEIVNVDNIEIYFLYDN